MIKKWMAVTAVFLVVFGLWGAWCFVLLVALKLAMAFWHSSSPPEPFQYFLGTFIPAVAYSVSLFAFRKKRYAPLLKMISILLSFPIGALLVISSLRLEHPPGNPGVGVVLVPLVLVGSATLLYWAGSASFKVAGNYLVRKRQWKWGQSELAQLSRTGLKSNIAQIFERDRA
jgi:hypothetical protein